VRLREPAGVPPLTVAIIGRVDQAVFYFDPGSPWCWLAAERVHEVLGSVPEWQPVLGVHEPVDREEVELAAIRQGLPAPRWPDPFPFDSELAVRAATFAKQTGRTVAFSLAAMRQAFAAGRDLSVQDNVLIAAAACELHPRAVLKAMETRSVREALVTVEAAGLEALPAVRLGGRVFTGPRAPELAAEG
jgi:2-hydroxychromene-2-carboxylate isomerase